ncbi:MAG: hypothetical protein KatS3mg132_579 [Limisphaera sp.]|nr:MAG: hypothetical protein KatS3mg132_579 [Limisphaera sp.]
MIGIVPLLRAFPARSRQVPGIGDRHPGLSFVHRDRGIFGQETIEFPNPDRRASREADSDALRSLAHRRF